jgi:hypothetical protein
VVQSGSTPQFTRRDYVVGRFPYSVAVADFNGDGVLDLAVANRGTPPDGGSVSVLLGLGDGTFGAERRFGVGGVAVSVAVGDFNGDGLLDLAVANYASNTVSVLLGLGDGTFAAERRFGVDSSPLSVAVGDFNGDGIPDLAVANAGSSPYYRDGSISILLGTGDGVFAAAPTIAAGDTPTSIAIADFNGSGMSDLVIVDEGYFADDPFGGYIFVAGTISRLFFGNGDGTFRSGVLLGVGAAPASVAVGDFNGDGVLDLAVANEFSGSVSVLLGLGGGTFAVERRFAVGSLPRSVAVGDFNSDGVLDLAVANSEFASGVSVLLGLGDGTFAAERRFGVGINPWAVAVGDFNGDGVLDLVVANFGSDSVSVLLGVGEGTFAAEQ